MQIKFAELKSSPKDGAYYRRRTVHS